MSGNYEQLIEMIAKSSGVSVEDIERKIEAKQAKLSGLISKEGAAQIIAAELGVNFDKEIIKISQIVPGMRKINLIGKIINLFPIREYNKNGRSGRIGSFILADESSNIRTVLWDENHIDLIANNQIVQEGIVEITNASLRNGELHLTSFSEIKPSSQVIDNVKTEKPVVKKKILDFNVNDSVSTRATIVQVFEPRFFQICPECRKKVSDAGRKKVFQKVFEDKVKEKNQIRRGHSKKIKSRPGYGRLTYFSKLVIYFVLTIANPTFSRSLIIRTKRIMFRSRVVRIVCIEYL